MILVLFLTLLASASALDCNVGTLIVENGVIASKSMEKRSCNGQCSRSTTRVSTTKQVVFMGCDETEVSNFVAEQLTCSESIDCYCAEDMCNSLNLEQKLDEIVHVGNANAAGPMCYVGYFATSLSTPGSPAINIGNTVYCDSNSACSSINATIMGYDVEAYFCIPTVVCNALLGQTSNMDNCGNVQNEMATVYGCCCFGGHRDCTALAKQNPAIAVPPFITYDNTSVFCYQGAQLNYNLINGGSSSQCAGSCSSFSIKTQMNNVSMLLELFTCDPVELCTAIGMNNQCGNIASTGTNSIIRGCCCNTNMCIDPRTTPPEYPQKTLKCYTGMYVPATGYSIGAEMMCDGQCSRLEVPVNGNIVKYMMCAPYSMCYGFGIANADQCYNPPLEQEVTICCYTGNDNCNIDPSDAQTIAFNQSVATYSNNPILCFNGIYINRAAMAPGSYAMCSGECATLSFVSTGFGQQHNTTIYTCAPVSMCKSAGITSGCSQVQPGVNACCCDRDNCYDPNRGYEALRTCFTGIYVVEDNYLTGGEVQCEGWCASLSTKVSSKNTTTYWCAPIETCRQFALGMGGDNNCNVISGTSNTHTGCCCSESNNCNLPAFLRQNVTSIPTTTSEPPIVCYEALWINGVNTNRDNYRVCNGLCTSMRMIDNVNSTTSIMSNIYTCTSSCEALGLRNGCGYIDGHVYTCCCDSDVCIDPTVNRYPDQFRTCYVGIQTSSNGGISYGADVMCDGKCVNLTSTDCGQLHTTTLYTCDTASLCQQAGISNGCAELQPGVTACCCDQGTCNHPNRPAHCLPGYSMSTTRDGYCIGYFSTPVTRNSATLRCKEDGGELASIANGFANNEVSQEIMRGGGSQAWLGLNCPVSQNANKCTNDDGTNSSYNNFGPGFPQLGPFGPCVYMDISGSANWYSDNCDVTTKNFVCEYLNKGTELSH